MPIKLLLCLLCFVHATYAQDYIKYHQTIMRAEEQAYVKQQIPEALKTYKQLFSQYDFVFVHDCVDAMQLALYVNDEKSFMVLVDKATQNGLLPRHMNMMRYIARHPIYIKNKDSIVNITRRNRPHYLKRLDTAAIKTMYSLFIHDQNEKNGVGLTETEFRRQYPLQIKQTMNDLHKFIAAKGWPSDKMIGIDQDDLMIELGIGSPEVANYFVKRRTAKRSGTDEYNLSSGIVLPIIIHYANFHADNSNRRSLILYSDSFYLNQIAIGNLHPKDLAFMYDERFHRLVGVEARPDPAKGEKYFATGIHPNQTYRGEHDRIPAAEINVYRKQYFMCTIEQARAKVRFCQAHGFFLGWGWNGSRC